MKLDITFEELGLDTMFCFKRGGAWVVYFSSNQHIAIKSVEAETLEQALEMVVERCKKTNPSV